MKNYLEHFAHLVDELKQQQAVRLLGHCTFPPAHSTAIARFEKKIGQSLSPTLQQFYRQSNGLQIRWIFEDNELLEEDTHQWQSTPVDWQYAQTQYRFEDGIIMILPIEEMARAFENTDSEAEDVQLFPFDWFHDDSMMALRFSSNREWLLDLVQDQYSDISRSNPTDIDSYFEFLLANKGSVHRRIYFYDRLPKDVQKIIHTPAAYWTPARQFQLHQNHLKHHFPLADQVGKSMQGLQLQSIWQNLASSPALQKKGLENLLEQHQAFLSTGGAGGEWSTLLVRGLTIGWYQQSKITSGQQAWLEHRRLDKSVSLDGVHLPYANLVGLYAPAQNFENADLSHSLCTDAMLDHSNFNQANLEGIDFSRASLRQVSFKEANLRGADFENCDLCEADFSHAQMEGARFPGAQLDGVRYSVTQTATL